MRRRRIGEMRQPPLATERQNLVRPDGEILFLTRQFREELRGEVPVWLRLTRADRSHGPRMTRVVLPGAWTRQATLVQHQVSRPMSWLWSWLRGKPLLSAEVEQAGTLFRLERYGIRTPRLLAFGQRSTSPWRVESLLLTEALAGATPLEGWLRREPGSEVGRCRHLLREAGDVLRRLHAAACYFPADGERVAAAFRVQTLPEGREQVVLAGVAALQRRHRPSARHAVQDLVTLNGKFGTLGSRTDALRFLLAYLDLRRLSPEARRLTWRILRMRPSARARHRAVLGGTRA